MAAFLTLSIMVLKPATAQAVAKPVKEAPRVGSKPEAFHNRALLMLSWHFVRQVLLKGHQNHASESRACSRSPDAAFGVGRSRRCTGCRGQTLRKRQRNERGWHHRGK